MNSNWVIRILTPCFIFGLLFVPCLSQAQPKDKELVPKVLPPPPLTAFQIAALTNPWPLVPGVYEFRASHSGLCIGRWESGSESLQQLPCGVNSQTLLQVTPSYDNWPMNGLPGTSARYIIRPLFIRNGETQPPLSLCAAVDLSPFFAVPVYSKSCSTTVCFASQDFGTWEFIDKGGFSTPGMGVMIKGSWASYSLNSSSAPTVDAWAVRDARTDASADVIIWSHSLSSPGPEAVFIPVLRTPLVTSAQFPSACRSPPAPQSERGTWVCGSASCNFAPVVGGVVLPNFTYRTDGAATSAAACGNDCAADPMCRAYSWCGPPRPGLTSCALKSAVSAPVGTPPSCTSGIVRP
jgi:hypothetical protein